MAKTANKAGGGAQTNANGLRFEQTSELRDSLKQYFTIKGDDIYDKDGKKVATLYKKHALYKNLLLPNGIDYRTVISKKLLPDEALYVYDVHTMYIIEKKFQGGGGSVDEKLQTCDFKKLQYERLLAPLGCRVEYCYFLSDWFQKDSYRDVKKYIESLGCRYFFGSIPLDYLNLNVG